MRYCGTDRERACTGGATRREFLKQASLGAAAVAAVHVSRSALAQTAPATATPAATTLPTIKMGDRNVTRLLAGYNPIGGYSHLTTTMSRIMSDYFTVEKTVEFLRHCEELGINTFQFDLTEKTEKALEILWNGGSKLQFLCLHPDRPTGPTLERVMQFKPFAIAHHGGVTDSMFRSGNQAKLRDFVKKVHDLGVLAGVSTHSPDNLRRMMDEGWENDFFMACVQNVARTREEMEKELGFATVGEPFIDSDRDVMTKVIREVPKTCLAFKILAAGRRCSSAASVESAFQFAFANIKKTDAVIVGMFPYLEDEVAADVKYVQEHGVVA